MQAAPCMQSLVKPSSCALQPRSAAGGGAICAATWAEQTRNGIFSVAKWQFCQHVRLRLPFIVSVAWACAIFAASCVVPSDAQAAGRDIFSERNQTRDSSNAARLLVEGCV